MKIKRSLHLCLQRYVWGTIFLQINLNIPCDKMQEEWLFAAFTLSSSEWQISHAWGLKGLFTGHVSFRKKTLGIFFVNLQSLPPPLRRRCVAVDLMIWYICCLLSVGWWHACDAFSALFVRPRPAPEKRSLKTLRASQEVNSSIPASRRW